MWGFARIAFVLLAVTAAGRPAAAAEDVHLRLGLVKFGSVAWEVDTLRRHGWDRSAGLVIDTVDLATPAAGEVALLAGGVDAIVTDWLWVARQRHSGGTVTFVPHNAGLGEIMVPPAAGGDLASLAGKRLGIAGGPLDKSWLLVRAYSRRQLGYDIADRVTPVYGAPPLLSQELASGRLDAVLTYWPFAARLSVAGYRSLLSLPALAGELGVEAPLPMLGFAVSDDWAARHPAALKAFLAAIGRADAVMERSDDEWDKLRPLTGAADDRILAALRDRFRLGIVSAWPATTPARAQRLLTLLAESGGADLTGGARDVPAGTFWADGAP